MLWEEKFKQNSLTFLTFSLHEKTANSLIQIENLDNPSRLEYKSSNRIITQLYNRTHEGDSCHEIISNNWHFQLNTNDQLMLIALYIKHIINTVIDKLFKTNLRNKLYRNEAIFTVEHNFRRSDYIWRKLT